ncbi:pyridoxamine 5'-phosphate oxidase [Sinirhodobacter populi]|uniref:Pyridoxamine 5'-phosphate oxidase n=1 Tax=Paenirhodobacter populi TaxID=2306993 RepID=A0A443ILW2_9RHOB|nr:pyridoxamine 5'-phosphate oxidase family protein [Sinirhodobacter populi]RWR05942.1 pyridoxamine 5'-phosphate oxidase [Sinirhodobacter populi]RWR27340.1 pyridoxamine 5'-phosphate oxidase [Sinirhodobacter populi]RWR27546.1 pyridoxamine 5'-phosphate oxidase [Sinirhodobacter populi]
MKTLTDAMKDMLATQTPIQATVTEGGIPNLGPKRSLRVYDDHTLIFNENTGGQTLANLRNGSRIAVAVIDREKLDGYRFLGTPEIFDKGAPFDNAVEFAGKNGMKTPKFAILVHIDEIFSLRSGPDAGKKMDELGAA